MKRNILLPFCLAAFILSSFTGISQNSFGIGPTLGFGPAAFKYTTSTTGTTYKGLIVPGLGIAGVFKLQPKLDLRAAILISPVEDKVSGNSSEAPYHHTNVYLKLPVDIMYVTKSGRNQFRIGGGPFFSTNITGNTKGLFFNNGLPNDNLKNSDWGLDLRAEYQIHSGFFISLFYDPGLQNLTNTQGDPAVHTVSSGFAIGYLFGWHKKK